MALRKVIFNVSKNGVEPLDYAWGGIQNEDNATEVNFVLDNEYFLTLNEDCETLFFRIDFESGFAGYHPSENLEVVDKTVKREIPKAITQFGGDITSTLVVTRLLNNGEYQQIFTETRATVKHLLALIKKKNLYFDLPFRLKKA